MLSAQEVTAGKRTPKGDRSCRVFCFPFKFADQAVEDEFVTDVARDGLCVRVYDDDDVVVEYQQINRLSPC